MCLAIPAKILKINGENASVDYGGITKSVNISLVDVKIGDYILIHAGFAIQTINKDEAMKNLLAIKELDNAIANSEN